MHRIVVLMAGCLSAAACAPGVPGSRSATPVRAAPEDFVGCWQISISDPAVIAGRVPDARGVPEIVYLTGERAPGAHYDMDGRPLHAYRARKVRPGGRRGEPYWELAPNRTELAIYWTPEGKPQQIHYFSFDHRDGRLTGSLVSMGAHIGAVLAGQVEAERSTLCGAA